ncbi:MAG: metallophosphoesterase [Clostridia bacterium]|nr:metallophosphoesterase [Clostridia bacterium]
MSHVRRILTHFGAFLMSVILTVLPYAGVALPVLDTKADDCLLNVSMISDTHLEAKGPFRQAFLRRGLLNLKYARCEVDALLVDGDLTNYGDEASIETFYRLVDKYSPVRTLISVPGNHDIGHVEDRDHDAVRESLIASYNAFMDTDYDKIYYTLDVKGYTFIVLCDEGERWDYCTITQDQLDFLDRELAAATADGKPVFVCCHWPIEGTNDEQTIWPGSGIELAGQDVKSILEKYQNVFFISGHMHGGIKSHAVEEKYGLSSAETENGVTYINLPTYGIINWFGYPWSGTGAQLEVYADRVLFRPRSFLTGHWFVNSEYTFALQ